MMIEEWSKATGVGITRMEFLPGNGLAVLPSWSSISQTGELLSSMDSAGSSQELLRQVSSLHQLRVTGSAAILEQYIANRGTPVKYGQCWVFPGVVTTSK